MKRFFHPNDSRNLPLFRILAALSMIVTIISIFALAGADDGIRWPDTHYGLLQFLFLTSLVSTLVFLAAYFWARHLAE